MAVGGHTWIVDPDDVSRIGLRDGLAVLSKETLRSGQINCLLHSAMTHLDENDILVIWCKNVVVFISVHW